MEQALLQAVTRGDVESVRRLVSQGVDINTRWRLSGNQSVLHYAANRGSTDVVNALLASGADIGALDANESTPLHEAARCGHLGVVKALIAHPDGLANVSPVDSDGATPLHLAARGGHIDVMEVLLANGSDLFAMNNLFHRTVLHDAARSRCVTAVEYVLERGADLTATDNSGRTVMHVGARTGSSDVMKALVAHGAPADTTALLEAVEIGAFAVVKTLLKHGADVSVVDSLGRTPLHCVVNDDDPQETSAMAEILLKYEANVSAVDNEDCTPLHAASRHHDSSVINVLLRHGASVHTRNMAGLTPLQVCLQTSPSCRLHEVLYAVHALMSGGATYDDHQLVPTTQHYTQGETEIIFNCVRYWSNAQRREKLPLIVVPKTITRLRHDPARALEYLQALMEVTPSSKSA